MASNNVCNSCVRALRQGPTRQVNGRIVHTRLSPRDQFLGRTFATTASRLEAGKPQEGPDASTMQKFAQRMRAQKQMKAATEPYVAYGATEDLFRACARAGEYTMPTVAEGEEPLRSAKGEDLGVGSGWWYEELGLAPTFNTWAQITYLHMYIVTVRLRMFPQQHAHHWHQNLLDHFSYAAEDRMVSLHNIAARSVRNKYLKDLFVQWRGVLAAYDEGLAKGDAVLASAVWRNIFAGDENVDAAAVANVVSYLKKNLRDFDRIADSDIASGDISFSDAVREAALVDRESRAMKQPIPEPTPTAPRV
ncbi:hypothetical protein D6D12_00369 [Aureobasidium pullulans]|uniref:Ubiquinol-cytochrome c chaperone domain-containing protein n=1 Tax=Aureobasidium pullulans TaxID=5580 RepID=A0AB74K6H3_AURPU|nr:hypothetical protein D6D12_00369 [Aureobasidium pullulans]THX65770.1 hypothetical protein D6D11_00195 [Aureobasidium pullulans]